MYGMEIRTLWCAVYGSSIVFKKSVHPDADVDDLKEKIQGKKGALRDHDASKLVLCKVSFYSWDQDLCFVQQILKFFEVVFGQVCSTENLVKEFTLSP